MLEEENEDWVNQVKFLEKIDEWTKKARLNLESLPKEYKGKILGYAGEFSGANCIAFCELLEKYDWNHNRVVMLYRCLIKIPLDQAPKIVSLLLFFVDKKLHIVYLGFLAHLRDYELMEQCDQLSVKDIHQLVEVIRHLDDFQYNEMIELLHSTNAQTIRDVLNLTNEPYAKQCQLCKAKRMHSLEHRMIHKQIPDDMIQVTGILPLIEKPQIWHADDEGNFRLDFENQQIFWFHFPVDLVRICDKCLSEVHHAASSHGR